MQLLGAKTLVPRKTAPNISKDLLRLAKTKSHEPRRRRSEYVKLDSLNMAALISNADKGSDRSSSSSSNTDSSVSSDAIATEFADDFSLIG